MTVIKSMEPLNVPKADRATRIGTGIFFTIFVALAALTAALPPVGNLSATSQEGGSVTDVSAGDTAWVMISAALVLFMTPGLAFFYGGMVSHANVISTMFQSFVAMCVISVLWVIVGFSLAFGKDANGNGIIGYPRTYYMFNDVGPLPIPRLCPSIPLVAFSMFMLTFAVITPALIAGGLAERINFSAWMIFISIWHLIVWCPLCHLMWHPDGLFRTWGALDFAGGTVVEMASGFAALAGAIYIGPRKTKLNTPANIPFIMLGTAIFWFGWLGFNAGSSLAANGLGTFSEDGPVLRGLFLDSLTHQLTHSLAPHHTTAPQLPKPGPPPTLPELVAC